MPTPMKVSALEPFGVQIELDLSQPLDSTAEEQFRSLYERHDLVVVPGQRLTLDEQLRAIGYLGPVLRTPDSIGEISLHSSIGLGGAELCFHSDYAFSPEPLLGISLHAIDVIDGETSTRFSSGRRAYDHLDAELRRRVDGLRSLQVFGATLDRRNRAAELSPDLPRFEHPLVWTASDGGRFLFAPYMTTDSIVGLDPADSEELIGQLFAVLYGSANVLDHKWRLGDLVIWNNCSVTHARGDNTRNERRVLQRGTLGLKGYAELYPQAGDYDWQDGLLVEAEGSPQRA